jgi:hypothetical protein
MKRVLRSALAIAAGGVLMLLLDGFAKRCGNRRNLTGLLLDLMRPAPVADETVEVRVRNRLARTATHPELITVSTEHGCVDLRGVVPTRERARIVRTIATVPGVDSVLDLMTEPPSASHTTVQAPSATTLLPVGVAARPEWAAAARIVAVGGGLGLTVASLRVGSLFFAVPAVAVGLLLIARGARATSRRHGLPREQRPRL